MDPIRSIHKKSRSPISFLGGIQKVQFLAKKMMLDSQIWQFAKWQPCSLGKKPEHILEILDGATKRRPNEAPSCKTHGAMAVNVAIRADFRFRHFFTKKLSPPTVFRVATCKFALWEAYDI